MKRYQQKELLLKEVEVVIRMRVVVVDVGGGVKGS